MVSKFEWAEKYETKIPQIDVQHKELFKHIDDLTLAMYSGNSSAEISEMISFLAEYIDIHFSEEEKLMRETMYPGYGEHRNAHRSFTAMFEKLNAEFIEKGPSSYLAIHIEKALRDWWVNHILNIDLKYSAHIRNALHI